MATADSNPNKAIWTTNKPPTIKSPNAAPVLPNKVISKCPATIFAINRTAKVPGRMMLLTVSMHTINGINTEGVPGGTKWASMWKVWLIQPKIIKLIHKGKPRVNVTAKWLVPVNTKGNKPKKLFTTMKKNNPTNSNVPPLEPTPNNSLNSLCNVWATQLQSFSLRVGINQKERGIITNPKLKLPQFKDQPKRPVVGSNTENKFTIIFNYEIFQLSLVPSPIVRF